MTQGFILWVFSRCILWIPCMQSRGYCSTFWGGETREIEDKLKTEKYKCVCGVGSTTQTPPRQTW